MLYKQEKYHNDLHITTVKKEIFTPSARLLTDSLPKCLITRRNTLKIPILFFSIYLGIYCFTSGIQTKNIGPKYIDSPPTDLEILKNT